MAHYNNFIWLPAMQGLGSLLLTQDSGCFHNAFPLEVFLAFFWVIVRHKILIMDCLGNWTTMCYEYSIFSDMAIFWQKYRDKKQSNIAKPYNQVKWIDHTSNYWVAFEIAENKMRTSHLASLSINRWTQNEDSPQLLSETVHRLTLTKAGYNCFIAKDIMLGRKGLLAALTSWISSFRRSINLKQI